jgi:folate-binding protein YgfZ
MMPAMIDTAAHAIAYPMLRTNAVWFEPALCWSAFRGDKAADALNGLVTNDVGSLAVGSSLHAAALTPKGKLVTDMLVVRLDATEFLIGVLPVASDAWLALARKYVNPRLCKVTDESGRVRAFTVFGVGAVDASAHIGVATSVHRVPISMLGDLPGVLLLADAADADDVKKRLAASPMAFGSPELWEIARVEAGQPAMGVDMDENTIPQEANLDALGAISFSKGCYTGQETVARVHFRGHVNRHLRGLASAVPLAPATEVVDADGKVVGDVRSSVHSPRFGYIALAMIRREVAIGSRVNISVPGASTTAIVVDLPFTRGE